MSRLLRGTRTGLEFFVVLAATVSSGAIAGAGPAPIQGDDDTDIVVTARKTVERAQDVPESLSVITPNFLDATPFQPGIAIARAAPNVQWINRTSGSQFFSIRGVSTLGTPVSFADGTVAVTVDGVPVSLMSASNALIDVADVEVLRGPQGTLWGTNALGGAINITTRQPDGAREYRIAAEGGSNGYASAEAEIGGPLVPDVLNGRFAARFGRQDGDIDSLYTAKLGKRDLATLRGSVGYVGLEHVTITLAGSYSDARANDAFYLLRDAPGFPVSGSLTEPHSKAVQASGSLKAEVDLGGMSLTSISAYQRNRQSSYLDFTDALVFERAGVPSVSSPGSYDDREDIFSQEVRLGSAAGARNRWIVGASAVRTNGVRACIAYQCAPAGVTEFTRLHATNLGLFADGSVHVGNHWEISGGGRLSHDRITDRNQSSADLTALSGRNATYQTYLTGRVALAYAWSHSLRIYGSVARGHATRVYPLVPSVANGIVPDPYPAAYGWTYEAGIKASLLRGHVDLAASVYDNEIKNGVLSYFDPASIVYRTTYQDYRTYGFELEIHARFTNHLRLNASTGYTHSALGANGAYVATVAGNPIPNTPRWTAAADIQYELPAAIIGITGNVTLALEGQYNGARSADPQQSITLRPYALANLKLGWQNSAKTLDLYLFARNLTDRRYETVGAGFLNVETVNVGAGRVVGVGVSRSIGG